MNEPHPITRRQYREQAKRDILAEYPDADRKAVEITADIHVDSYWWPSVERYVRAGGVLRVKWLNTLTDRQLQAVMSAAGPHNPFPLHYVLPWCRDRKIA